MKTVLKTALLLGMFFNFSQTTEAKDISRYDLKIGLDQPMSEWADATKKWKCHVDYTVLTQEQYTNPQGQVIHQSKKLKHSNDESFLTHPALRMHFERTAIQGNTPIEIEVEEVCEQTRKRTITKTRLDSNDRPKKEEKIEKHTVDVKVKWKCTLPSLPSSSSSNRAQCELVDTDFLADLLLGYRFKKLWDGRSLVTTVALESVRDLKTFNFCAPEDKNAVHVLLHQRARDGVFSGKTTFNIKIDQQELKLTSMNGLLDEDIQYCTDQNKVRVQVTADQDGLFFDHQFVGEGGAEAVTLSRFTPGNTGQIKLAKRLFRNGLSNERHQIQVTLIDPKQAEAYDSEQAVHQAEDMNDLKENLSQPQASGAVHSANQKQPSPYKSPSPDDEAAPAGSAP